MFAAVMRCLGHCLLTHCRKSRGIPRQPSTFKATLPDRAPSIRARHRALASFVPVPSMSTNRSSGHCLAAKTTEVLFRAEQRLNSSRSSRGQLAKERMPSKLAFVRFNLNSARTGNGPGSASIPRKSLRSRSSRVEAEAAKTFRVSSRNPTRTSFKTRRGHCALSMILKRAASISGASVMLISVSSGPAWLINLFR